jgi:Phage minor capsid protein 2.
MASDKPIFSEQVMFRDKRLATLFSFYKAATKQLVSTLNNATDFSRYRNIQTLKQIDLILGKLDKNTSNWVKKEIEFYYKEYGKDTIAQLEKDGFPVATSFTQIDDKAVASLADEIMTYYRESFSGAKRSAMRMLNEAAKNQVQTLLAVGKITGDDRRAIADKIAGYLKEGFVALIDKGGRKWSLESYANMLTRTMLVKTANEGTVSRLMDGGYDLVQVSEHVGACPLCGPWAGKILSLSGKHPEYPTVDRATENGLFHPNCRHRLLPYHEKLSEVSTVWNPDLQRYIMI